MRPLPGSKFFYFHAVFWPNNRLAPHLGSWYTPVGKFWIRYCCFMWLVISLNLSPSSEIFIKFPKIIFWHISSPRSQFPIMYVCNMLTYTGTQRYLNFSDTNGYYLLDFSCLFSEKDPCIALCRFSYGDADHLCVYDNSVARCNCSIVTDCAGSEFGKYCSRFWPTSTLDVYFFNFSSLFFCDNVSALF